MFGLSKLYIQISDNFLHVFLMNRVNLMLYWNTDLVTGRKSPEQGITIKLHVLQIVRIIIIRSSI